MTIKKEREKAIGLLKECYETIEGKNKDGSDYDGWGANIEVKEVTSSEATKIRKKSRGFCGYEWMVDSYLDTGR